MNARRVAGLLLIAALVLAGCKGAEIAGGILRSIDANIGGVPVSGYAESAIKGGAVVARSLEDFTPEQEYYIGRSVTAGLLETYRPLPSAPANEYVNTLGQSLALYSDMPLTYSGYRFQIVDSDEINAFAAPGGFILVTRGLIRCCPDETALAAVLAHEIAHIQNRDAMRAIGKARITQALGVIGAESARHLAGAELAQLTDVFADSVGDVIAGMVNNGYSRSAEYAADQGAVAILKGAGYDPGGLLAVLQRMDVRLSPGGKDFAKTHPKPGDRIAELAGLGLTPPGQEPPARLTRFRQALGSL